MWRDDLGVELAVSVFTAACRLSRMQPRTLGVQ